MRGARGRWGEDYDFGAMVTRDLYDTGIVSLGNGALPRDRVKLFLRRCAEAGLKAVHGTIKGRYFFWPTE